MPVRLYSAVFRTKFLDQEITTVPAEVTRYTDVSAADYGHPHTGQRNPHIFLLKDTASLPVHKFLKENKQFFR